jgi:GrpB-like predicted nucleotidyltransferase (UPF0157 family)
VQGLEAFPVDKDLAIVLLCVFQSALFRSIGSGSSIPFLAMATGAAETGAFSIDIFDSEMTDPIIVVDYDPQWPELFKALRTPIAGALGDLAAAVEHIGSTAVPGLAAKPVIDIDVLLASTAGLPEAVRRLASVGYGHRGNLGVDGREAFRQPPGPAHHLYVCPADSVEYRRHIAFRDYLRAHPEIAKVYAELKGSLAVKHRDERQRYNAGKEQFVEEILRQALA